VFTLNQSWVCSTIIIIYFLLLCDTYLIAETFNQS